MAVEPLAIVDAIVDPSGNPTKEPWTNSQPSSLVRRGLCCVELDGAARDQAGGRGGSVALIRQVSRGTDWFHFAFRWFGRVR
jgi:hypothetical protein